MKHIYTGVICLVFILGSGRVSAQEPCATGSKLIPKNAAGLSDLQMIRTNIANAPFTKQQGDTLIFPTVVHIIHNGLAGNISDSQVVDGLRIINEDFNRENPDTSITRDIFKPHAAAVGFKFVLAKLDSNGDSTSAIVRIDTSITPHPEPTSSDFDNCKFLSHWPADMYYNVWIVPSIQGGSLGYAQYPGTNFTYGGPWSTWGIVVKHNHWGTIGTSWQDGRTGTHEVGHTFGLYHTFLSSSADCGTVCDTTGDEVCDTPPGKYVSGSCPQTQNTCANDTVGPSAFDTNIVDQIENFMSYKTCQNMLSQGQKERMRGFIASFPTLQGLSSDSNLLATGIIEALPVGLENGSEELGTVTISPNPFVSEVDIIIENENEIQPEDVSVLNLLGQSIEFSIVTSTFLKGKQQFILSLDSNSEGGLYFLVLETATGTRVAKMIKE